MDRIELPRAAAFRLQALFAAAVVTLSILSGIDALAGREASALVAAATVSQAHS